MPTHAASAGPAVSRDSVRYHGMDALRAFALLLGVFFHGAESFVPYIPITEWPVKDTCPSDVLGSFFFISHVFRMAVFYLIAGFFARLLLERIGVASFVRHRLERIAGPLVVGWLVLYPLALALWFWGGAVGGREPLGVGMTVFDRTLRAFTELEFIGERFSLLHLWFLYYLLMLYVVALSVWAGWRMTFGRHAEVQARLDALARRLLASRWAAFALALPTAVVLLFQGGLFGVATPMETLVPNPAVLIAYLLFFGVGWLLHRQPSLLEVLARRWPWHLVGGFVLTWFFHVFFAFGWHEAAAEHGWLVLLFVGVYGLVMWLWTLGLLGLFHQRCQRPSRRWRYLADSSYWLYLVHIPVVIALQIVVARWPWPWPIKYSLLMVVALTLLLLSYDLLVRGSWLGKMLNGRRYSRALRAAPAASRAG